MEDDIRERLQAGRFDQAFDLLVERFKDKVFRLAFSFLRDESHAEDTAQEVFLKIWKALPTYHGEARLSTWIYTITRNTCLTEIKRRNARPTVSLESPEMEGATDMIPALRFSDPESGLQMDVETLLKQLPEKYRQVIVLYYLEQKTYEEVAEMLGIPLGTVKTLLFRAKKEFVRLTVTNGKKFVPVSEGSPGVLPSELVLSKTEL